MPGNMSEQIVGLDIGTSKVSCVIAEFNEDNEISIIGAGTTKSTGLARGTIVDMEKTQRAICEAVESAEQMAGLSVETVYVGIAGKNISSTIVEGLTSLNDDPKDRSPQEITEKSIDDVKSTALASLQLPVSRVPIHEIPIEFQVDDEDSIHNPIGMTGTTLKAKVNVITASKNAEQNIRNCVRKAGIEAESIILEPLASAEACLTDSERETGVCLIDIGHGTTDVSVYCGGVMTHSAVITVGGSNMTKDISVVEHIPEEVAEHIKIKYGSLKDENYEDGDKIDMSSEGCASSKPLERKIINDILRARVVELLQSALHEIQRGPTGGEITCGAVLTGGASKMAGIQELATEILGMSVRLGSPQGVVGMQDMVQDPSFSTCVGLVLCKAKKLRSEESEYVPTQGFQGFISRVIEFMRNAF